MGHPEHGERAAAVQPVPGVRQANALTVRWLRAAGSGSTPPPVLSGAGAWPLLACLAAGAGGRARAELAEATGVDPGEALAVVRAYAAALAGSTPSALAFASGFWSSPRVTLDPSWTDGLPPAWRGALTDDPAADKASLDGWASDRTFGLIPAMPISLTPQTVLVLATALAVRTLWVDRFQDAPLMPQAGPWRTDRPWLGLSRGTSDLGLLRVLNGTSGPVSLVTVAGADDVDVHLALGEPDAVPADVLATAIEDLHGGVPSISGESVEEGPGVSVHSEPSYEEDPAPVLRFTTVGFDVTADHDLLRLPGVFGLKAAAGTPGDHFPGISADPIAVSDAAQSAMAVFSAKGFEAAAVTAVGMRCTGAFSEPDGAPRRVLRVDYTRPFGYVAVHRPTGLALVAGWVRQPKRFPMGR